MAGYSQAQVNASLAANPNASTGGYQGSSVMAPSYNAPGSSASAPPPGSVDAAEQYAGASDAYKRALIRFNSQRTGLLRQYGYAGDINAENGMMQNLRVDNTNTHGALQTLLGQQAGEDQNAEYAAEDRGLHGGLAHQAESALHSQHGGQSAALVQQLLGGFGDLDSQQLDAKSTLDAALWQLQHQATTDAVDNGDYNPAGTDPQAPSDPAARPPAAPSSKAKQAAVLKILTKATNAGEPTSEHGYGSQLKPAVKKALANAYTNGSKKRG